MLATIGVALYSRPRKTKSTKKKKIKAAAGSRTSMGIQLLHHGQVHILLTAFLVQHDLSGHAHAP